MSRHWTVLPNFVDCGVFRPVAGAAERAALRQALGIPPEAFVIGCVAAVKKHHKRIDYLIREVAQLLQSEEASREGAKARSEEIIPSAGGGRPLLPFAASRLRVSHSSPYLLIAGAKTGDTPELIALAESLMPGRYKILTDCGRDHMPDLYRCMDVFVLSSLFEMMPIAVLEALATGLPVLCNNHPVLEWMIGAENASPRRHGEGGMGEKEGEQADEENAVRSSQMAGTPFDKIAQHRSGGGGDETGYKTSSSDSPLFLSPLRASVVKSFSFHCGGVTLDMVREGALATALGGVTPEWIAEHGKAARARAVEMFSKDVVIGKYVEYYREVMGEGGEEGKRLHH